MIMNDKIILRQKSLVFRLLKPIDYNNEIISACREKIGRFYLKYLDYLYIYRFVYEYS